MTLNLTLPVVQHTDFSPRITVIGVGGGGTNAVNNMIAMGLEGVEFVVANTDAQSLVHSKAEKRVQLGPHLTQGLGAGAKPEIGRAAAEEATEELARHLEGCHMVFITAGMGGGTGTGAAPVIARMARERGVLTVGVVTKPFDFEGPKRKRASESGIEELQNFVDTLIIIPNQNLFRMATERTTFAEAFKLADEVLYDGVRGVTDLMIKPGLVNLDFADIRTVMAEMGKAVMGTGEADGDDRAVKAAERAISNPLLDDASLRGARGVLINITGGYDMTLFEVDEAANRIRKEVDEDAQIIFGTSVEEDLNGRLRVSVVATGIDAQQVQAATPAAVQPASPVAAAAPQPGLTMLPGGRPGRPATTAAMMPAATPGAPRVAIRGGALRAAAAPSAATAPAAMASAPSLHMMVQPEEAAAPVAAPAPVAVVAPVVAAPVVAQAPVAAPQPPVSSGFGGLFRRVTGAASGGMMRRSLTEPTPAPVAPRLDQPAPQRPPEAPHAAPHGQVDFEIPTFLRRQSN
ncbi:cell division protein FtsZ [Belnapia rosea]|uniref:Cell division protein FtsZ n=1 Tax=Belnapia rosea TaxID=938405 RepID=A0A1G6P0W8_9PROT|nr:cell division protein FtsZ [Belnapia rosea]SDB52437.1 cell division protein FtsZ [Belnapia rosea]SDC73097.1 cell division protein FtsZ [Belnapia rosea]